MFFFCFFVCLFVFFWGGGRFCFFFAYNLMVLTCLQGKDGLDYFGRVFMALSGLFVTISKSAKYRVNIKRSFTLRLFNYFSVDSLLKKKPLI